MCMFNTEKEGKLRNMKNLSFSGFHEFMCVRQRVNYVNLHLGSSLDSS